MPRKIINIDELTGDPIVVRVGGVDYPVSELSTEEYLNMIRIEEQAREGGVVSQNVAIIEQAQRLLPTYPWAEKPMPITAVFAIIAEVASELGEAQRARLTSRPTIKKVK